ncbi:methyl-accepting chemotaxis protein [Paenibacillus sp. 1P07SE]|uniref:methyl-accepting chemotaxis protein n=1 Tax=Paenibacillus sp. 1P07SE TaxID=3132209 RepID=UPI0039A520B3
MITRWNLVRKLVLGITLVAATTYGTSAFFIFVVKDAVAPAMPTWLFTTLTLGMGVFWTGLLGWLAARWLVKPINALQQAAGRAADGVLTETVAVPRAEDELRHLAQSFNHMISNLRGIVSDIDRHSTATGTEAGHLRGAAEQSATRLGEITTRVDAISHNTDTQANLSRTMYGTVQTMSELTAAAFKEAAAARSDVSHMQEAAASSSSAMERLAAAMQELARDGVATAHIVKRLEAHADRIDNILSVVEDISARTHLLALNASIEAAHAGSHGRGFEVVALEIRKLAQHSSQEVQHIARLVQDIHSDLALAASRMADQAQQMQTESDRTQTSRETMASIFDSVHRTAQTIEDVAGLMDAQSEKMRSVLDHARQVSDAAADNADRLGDIASAVQEQNGIVQEVAAASHELEHTAETLQERVRQFRYQSSG